MIEGRYCYVVLYERHDYIVWANSAQEARLLAVAKAHGGHAMIAAPTIPKVVA